MRIMEEMVLEAGMMVLFKNKAGKEREGEILEFNSKETLAKIKPKKGKRTTWVDVTELEIIAIEAKPPEAKPKKAKKGKGKVSRRRP